MLYHYVFNTYKRKNSLDSEMRKFLQNIFFKIAEEKGFEIMECEIVSDHVHLLVEQKYTLSNSQAMKFIKGVSARRFFQEYPSNRLVDRKLWGRGFYARKVLGNSKEVVSEYIRNQVNSEGEDKRYSQGAPILIGAGPAMEPRIYSQVPN